MSATPASVAQRVALLGFGDFERSALVSYLRLSGTHVPAYQEADSLANADFVIADADHAGTLDVVLGADRVADAVFIGSLAPDGALAWMMRPIDPLQVFRELDATVALRRSQGMAAAPPEASKRVVRDTTPEASASKSGTTRRAGDVSAPTEALLVDDSEIALRYLERQLQALGLRTETAMHSQRALELLGQRAFAVVFLDLELGPHSELDGLALCQQIKRQHEPAGAPAAPKVVMVTAHTSATDRVRGSFAGCDAFLGKPIDDDALRRCLRGLGLRLAAPAEGYINSRPGALQTRPLPLDSSG
jgi:two-component system cell cycle response regulator